MEEIKMEENQGIDVREQRKEMKRASTREENWHLALFITGLITRKKNSISSFIWTFHIILTYAAHL